MLTLKGALFSTQVLRDDDFSTSHFSGCFSQSFFLALRALEDGKNFFSSLFALEVRQVLQLL